MRGKCDKRSVGNLKMKEIQLILLFSVTYFCHVVFGQYGPAGSLSDPEFCESINTVIKCDPSERYRRLNGRCNNLESPFLGAAHTRFVREGNVRYANGISSPPRSVSGSELPSARLISLFAFNDLNEPDKKLTVATMQFGQFVAHDLAGSIGRSFKPGSCCSENGQIVNSFPMCFFIPVPSHDPVHIGEACLDFVRDIQDSEINCSLRNTDIFVNPDIIAKEEEILKEAINIEEEAAIDTIDTSKRTRPPAQQLNRVTSFLDLSLIYGNNDKESASLRLFKHGFLITDNINGQQFPPQNPNGGCFQAPDESCFLSGDARLNIVPQLTILHILFIREHNRVARYLQKFNPQWQDEQLFQEARRICIAEYQYIVYYEWLPELLGWENVKKAGLYFQDSGPEYSDEYNPSIDPSVINEFTAGAFRFFHTQIEGNLNDVSEDRNTVDTSRLSDVFFKPALLTQGENFQAKCRGMTFQSAQSMDRNYDREIRTYFLKNNRPIGTDLKAIDIQRDRDHGLTSYNRMRSIAGLPLANDWSGYLDVISLENVERLKKIYKYFEDVDLSVGGALENPYYPEVGHGPTYNYLLLKQFYNTRVGDRFWFEFTTYANPFTPEQLVEIRKSSMARIICDNGGGIELMQKNAFLVPDSILKCDELRRVDLSLWQE